MPRQPQPGSVHRGMHGTPRSTARRHLLARGKDQKEAAWKELYRILAGKGKTRTPVNLTLEEAADLFLNHSRVVHDEGTYKVNRSRLQTVCGTFGRAKVEDLKVSAIDAGIALRECSQATKRGYLVVLKTALKWCRDEGGFRRPGSVGPAQAAGHDAPQPAALAQERDAVMEKAAAPVLPRLPAGPDRDGGRPHVIRAWRPATSTARVARPPSRASGSPTPYT